MRPKIPMAITHLVVAALAVIATACGGTAPGARPDEMSAAEHDRAAHDHETMSQSHEQQYDPAARATGTAVDVTGLEGAGTTYNPTDGHRDEAVQHHRYAQEHAAAAQELRRFDQAECHGIPADTRVTCPLLGGVASVEDIDGGVRLHLAAGTSGAAMLEQLRCHFAFARSRGYDGMPECPLYLRGLDVRAGANGTIEIVTGDAATVERLRARAHAHITGGS